MDLDSGMEKDGWQAFGCLVGGGAILFGILALIFTGIQSAGIDLPHEAACKTRQAGIPVSLPDLLSNLKQYEGKWVTVGGYPMSGLAVNYDQPYIKTNLHTRQADEKSSSIELVYCPNSTPVPDNLPAIITGIVRGPNVDVGNYYLVARTP